MTISAGGTEKNLLGLPGNAFVQRSAVVLPGQPAIFIERGKIVASTSDEPPTLVVLSGWSVDAECSRESLEQAVDAFIDSGELPADAERLPDGKRIGLPQQVDVQLSFPEPGPLVRQPRPWLLRRLG